MRQTLKSRLAAQAIGALLATLFLAGVCALAQSGARTDPVDDLRQALQLRLGEQGTPTPAVRSYRRTTLLTKVDKLRTIGDLRRALALEEWKDVSPVANKSIREIDAEVRQQVAKRLTAAYQDMIKTGDATDRIAVANSITEIGPTIRSAVEGDPSGYARTLTPEVIQLAKDKNLGVRQEGLRALGNIFAKPQDAVPVFQATLSQDAPGPKRLAADGLGQLIRVVNHLQKRGLSASGVDAGRGDVLDAVATAVPGNGAGLKDPDPQLRALCLQNIQVAAEALADIIPNTVPQSELPPEGRELTPEEKKFLQAKQEDVGQEIKDLMPSLSALRTQAPALARSLEDPDTNVRMAAVEALESIGNARFRLKRRVLSVPPDDAGDDRGNRALLAANDPLELLAKNLESITRLLRESRVELRRKAVEFLEIIEDKATPALPLLAEALNDPDRFVRWSAARAISNIAPAKADVAVPGLAKLLCDPDLGVRLAATKTLTDMGTVAAAAVPALAAAATNGDTEARVAAMEALQSIGPRYGKAAVPSLIEALKNSDPRARRVAARTLGGLGRDASAARPALRRALGDEDQEVRIFASDALLDISQRREKY